MIEAILLYGSRARGDEQINSDVDLLGIRKAPTAHQITEKHKVNLHIYSYDWLLREASKGELFLMHISHEAVAIFDPLALLKNISEAFVFKASYLEEIETSLRILRAVVDLAPLEFNPLIRRRYFWALRTAIIATAADAREVKFAAGSLEAFSTVNGLAQHISGRDTACATTCKNFSKQVLMFVESRYPSQRQSDRKATATEILQLTNLRKMVQQEQRYGI